MLLGIYTGKRHEMNMTELILFMVLCYTWLNMWKIRKQKKNTNRVMKAYERVTEKERHREKTIVFSLTFAWFVLISQEKQRFR